MWAVQSLFERCPEGAGRAVTRDDLVWAMECVLSRAFNGRFGGGQNVRIERYDDDAVSHRRRTQLNSVAIYTECAFCHRVVSFNFVVESRGLRV